MGALYRLCVSALVCIPGCALAQLEQPQFAIPQFPPGATFDARQGIVKLDVEVIGKSGVPVAGLAQQDFTLLDNNQAQQPVSFAAFDNIKSFPDPPAQLVFFLDQFHIDPAHLPAAERAVKEFLLKNDGHLEQPTSIYRLSQKGLYASAYPTMNGLDLAKEIDSGQEPRAVRSAADASGGSSCAAVAARKMVSPEVLGAIVIEQRRMPGRKVMIWIGPGWGSSAPSCWPGESIQEPYDWVTEFSTRMREARIALYVLNPWDTAGMLPFDYRHFTGGVRPRDFQPAYLALQVLAVNSGGQVSQDDKIEKAIERFAGYAGVFYTVTFDPPRAADVDEYHALQVKVSVPGAAASTWTGYYDQPSYYDQQPTFEPISVAQLESRLDALSHLRDADSAKQLASLQLTERLSSSRLAPWETRLRHREKTLETLVALADESEFLTPPAAEIPQRPAPSLDEQRQMMARTVNYLASAIPTLPDFFARRSIVHYEEDQPKNPPWKTSTGDGTLHPSREISETVHYRNGMEAVDDAARASHRKNKEGSALDAQGTFGAILNIVIPDAAQSDLEWSRWEQTAHGLRAVFRFVVPAGKSHYHLSFCCLTDMSGSEFALPMEQTQTNLNWTTGYRGEIMIDIDTGEILRLTLRADLVRLPLDRADLMVLCARTRIGDRTYVCPRRSVAITRGRTRQALYEWGDNLQVLGPFRTMLNDIDYSQYRKFGSTMRILPGFTEAPK